MEILLELTQDNILEVISCYTKHLTIVVAHSMKRLDASSQKSDVFLSVKETIETFEAETTISGRIPFRKKDFDFAWQYWIGEAQKESDWSSQFGRIVYAKQFAATLLHSGVIEYRRPSSGKDRRNYYDAWVHLHNVCAVRSNTST